jgi:hypothetical protein
LDKHLRPFAFAKREKEPVDSKQPGEITARHVLLLGKYMN